MANHTSRITGWAVFLTIIGIIAGIYYGSQDNGTAATYNPQSRRDKYGLLASDYDRNGWAKVRGEWVSNPRTGSVVRYSGGNTTAVPATRSSATVSQKSAAAGIWDAYNYAINKAVSVHNRGIDISGDGKSNCIDAAVTFYLNYEPKDCVRIVYTIFNDGAAHLFNQVYIGGNWIDVEPQNTDKTIQQTFPNNYNAKKNKVVTFDYVKKMWYR